MRTKMDVYLTPQRGDRVCDSFVPHQTYVMVVRSDAGHVWIRRGRGRVFPLEQISLSTWKKWLHREAQP